MGRKPRIKDEPEPSFDVAAYTEQFAAAVALLEEEHGPLADAGLSVDQVAAAYAALREIPVEQALDEVRVYLGALAASEDLTERAIAATKAFGALVTFEPCPHCGADLIPHGTENPHTAGAVHCNGCGCCFQDGEQRPGHELCRPALAALVTD